MRTISYSWKGRFNVEYIYRVSSVLPLGMKRQTIVFDDRHEELVENYRSKQRPIPSFTSAVYEMIEKASKTK